MQTIVITGSTRGIGRGMAEEFLKRGHRVVISGRSTSSVEDALARLADDHPPERIFGQPCDVRDHGQVQALWDAAVNHFGRVDLWVNNAGITGERRQFWKLSAEEIEAVPETNLTGTMSGCRTALRGMLEQGGGAVYNMEGLGSDGRRVEGLILYGATKRAVRYFTEGLIEETADLPVLVGLLSPGMVLTDLLTDRYQGKPEQFEQAKKIFNILADKVETVTPWLVEQMLENEQHGAEIRWLTRTQVVWRFLTAPFRKRDLFEEEGKESKTSGRG